MEIEFGDRTVCSSVFKTTVGQLSHKSEVVIFAHLTAGFALGNHLEGRKVLVQLYVEFMLLAGAKSNVVRY